MIALREDVCVAASSPHPIVPMKSDWLGKSPTHTTDRLPCKTQVKLTYDKLNSSNTVIISHILEQHDIPTFLAVFIVCITYRVLGYWIESLNVDIYLQLL